MAGNQSDPGADMNLLYGEIVEVLSEEGVLIGRVRVHGATKKIPLGLLTDARKVIEF